MGKWKWRVTCYYADNVKPPKKPDELAIRTMHATDSSKDMEVAAGKSRSDIGRIEVVRIPD
jgi:hypothetical protein